MSTHRHLSNVVGFDDAPFAPAHRGDVPVVGAVYADRRLDGVLIGAVRKDGANATRRLVRLIAGSKFDRHVQLVLLQGITLAGFNVVDVRALHGELNTPVLVVARRVPDLAAIEAALRKLPGGARRWRVIERLGPMEPLRGVHVQRAGLTEAEAAWVLDRFVLHGRIPEPLRTAHLIAGAIGDGESRGRA